MLWTPDQDSAAGGDGPVGSPVDRRGLEGTLPRKAIMAACFQAMPTSFAVSGILLHLISLERNGPPSGVVRCFTQGDLCCDAVWPEALKRVSSEHTSFIPNFTWQPPQPPGPASQELIVPITTRVDILHGAGAGWGLISTNLSQDWMLNRNARLLTFLGRENCQAT